jgi:hypothetical protein
MRTGQKLLVAAAVSAVAYFATSVSPTVATPIVVESEPAAEFPEGAPAGNEFFVVPVEIVEAVRTEPYVYTPQPNARRENCRCGGC